MAIHVSILAWKIPWTKESWWATIHRVTKVSDKTYQLNNNNNNTQQKTHIQNGGGGGLVTKSCLTLVTPWTVALQVMGFSR